MNAEPKPIEAPNEPGAHRRARARNARTVNLRQMFAEDYLASAEPRLLHVPAAKYLTLEPRRSYTTSRLVDEMQRLYDIAFAVKTNARQQNRWYRPYTLSMMEALFWGARRTTGLFFVSSPREDWAWRLLLRLPAFIEPADLDAGLDALARQEKTFEAGEVKLQVLDEGDCVQFLMAGQPLDDLDAAIRAKRFAKTHGLVLTGVQHEIFVNNVLQIRPMIREVIYRFPVVSAGTPAPHGPRLSPARR